MKSPYVSELVPNQVVTTLFLVQHKDVRQKNKSGDPYLLLMLGDRSGDIDARMWDNVAEVMDTFQRDDFVRVKGVMQIFQGRPQFTIHKMIRVQDHEVDFTDYFPCSERDSEEMFAELRGIIASVGDPHLRGLLTAFMDDERIARSYKIAPAAKSVHHAFLGGLLEHVLSMCVLARLTCSLYKNVDVDLVVTGAILHDVGKIFELTYDRSFGYSTEGQLLGHIVIALRMIAEKIAGIPDFPPTLRTLVEHLIISHHGELEFGSPRVPLFPEAMLLHHLDNLDSKMECMRATIARDRHAEGCWTAYSPSLERPVFKKTEWLNAAAGAGWRAAAEAAVVNEAAPQAEMVTHANGSPHPAWSAPAAPPPRPPVPEEKPRPLTGSAFSEKLQEALKQQG